MPRTRRATLSRRRPGRGRRRVIKYRRSSLIQPNIITRKLKTVYNGSLNAGAGAIVVDVVSLSNARDPTASLGSGQPLGFDQYHTLYRRNCVVGFKVKIEFCSTDNTNPLVVGFCPKTDSTALTSYPHYKECKGVVSTVLTPDVDKSTLTNKGSVKKWMLHRGAKILDNESLCGTHDVDPTSILYGHIFAQAMDGAADPATARYVLTIEQVVVFFEPLVPARS